MSRRAPYRARRTSRQSARRDHGAALIIAIGFVVMIGAIAAGLSSLVTSAMQDRGILTQLRNREYAADGAIEAAIAHVRSLGAAAGGSCTGATGATEWTTDTLNGQTMRVDWSPACVAIRGGDGIVVEQRNVVFVACPDISAPCTDATAVIRAQVNFEQSAAGVVTNTYVQTWSVHR